MRMVDLIEKKKDNVVLTDEEIHELIQGYTKKVIFLIIR